MMARIPRAELQSSGVAVMVVFVAACPGRRGSNRNRLVVLVCTS